MQNEDESWVGVEAKKEGFPVLLRIRKITPEIGLTKLCVLTWKYSEDSSSRLPSDEFYLKLERFEQQAIYGMERERLGMFVVSETGLGRTRYYLYTSSVEDLVSFMQDRIGSDESVEFASDDDEAWSEYRHFRQLAD